jgi:hypothetical protein
VARRGHRRGEGRRHLAPRRAKVHDRDLAAALARSARGSARGSRIVAAAGRWWPGHSPLDLKTRVETGRRRRAPHTGRRQGPSVVSLPGPGLRYGSSGCPLGLGSDCWSHLSDLQQSWSRSQPSSCTTRSGRPRRPQQRRLETRLPPRAFPHLQRGPSFTPAKLDPGSLPSASSRDAERSFSTPRCSAARDMESRGSASSFPCAARVAWEPPAAPAATAQQFRSRRVRRRSRSRSSGVHLRSAGVSISRRFGRHRTELRFLRARVASGDRFDRLHTSSSSLSIPP